MNRRDHKLYRPEYLHAEDAARELGISPATLQSKRSRGELDLQPLDRCPLCRDSNRRVYLREEVERMSR